MAGGFPVGAQWNAVQSSKWITVTASATINTAGAYTQAIPSTSRDATWVHLTVADDGTSNVLSVCGVNIATGASGSEVVQVANLAVHRSATAGSQDSGVSYLFPLAIPAGTRVAVSAQSNVASETLSCAVILFDDAFASIPGGGAIDTYGFSTATSLGTSIDPGATANTKGAWVQITGSTTYDLAGFFLGLDGTSQTPGSATYFFNVDVGVGAAGSEVVVLPDFSFVMTMTNAPRRSLRPSYTPFLPIQVPAGSRIAVRAQCTGASSPSRLFGATFYGVRL